MTDRATDLHPDVAAAVAEAYTPEGQDVWRAAWLAADDAKRRRLERGVLAEWSGPHTTKP